MTTKIAPVLNFLAASLIASASMHAAAHSASQWIASGKASVTDGDTLRLNDARVRLFGIDAPEGRQRCQRSGKDWDCGAVASAKLREMIAGRVVSCSGVDVDRDGRQVAICMVGKIELNAEMVRLGLALDYAHYSRGRYAAQEAEARKAKRGMWAGSFVPPWEWRKQQK